MPQSCDRVAAAHLACPSYAVLPQLGRCQVLQNSSPRGNRDQLKSSWLSVQLSIGFTLLIIGSIIQALICCVCCFIVKFAREIASGKSKRPENAVGGALYDVSAKYGNYVPGGAALGVPAGQAGVQPGIPAAEVQQPPAGYATPGSPTAKLGYDGNTSYDSPGYRAPWGGTSATPYGSGAAGKPPAGYPSNV
jgi:hypothetical protein